MPVCAYRWRILEYNAETKTILIDRCAVLPAFRKQALLKNTVNHVMNDIYKVCSFHNISMYRILLLIPKHTWLSEKLISIGHTFIDDNSIFQYRGGLEYALMSKVL